MFEYIVRETSWVDRLDEAELTELGKKGWELVGFALGADYTNVYIFKRPLEEQIR
jgi:hypothetical protein